MYTILNLNVSNKFIFGGKYVLFTVHIHDIVYDYMCSVETGELGVAQATSTNVYDFVYMLLNNLILNLLTSQSSIEYCQDKLTADCQFIKINLTTR